MAGNVKLLTSAGGGVVLDTATTTATDVTVKVPVTGVNNGTLACTDANGNLGLGVTPSAWNSIFKTIQVGAQGAVMATSVSMQLGCNVFYDGAYKYIGTGNANRYYLNDGKHIWETAPSGTAGNAISFTQAMTLDASGNLGIGTSSPSGKLQIDLGNLSTVGAKSNSGLNITGNSGATGNIYQIGFGYATGATNVPAAIYAITTSNAGFNYNDICFATRSVTTDTAPTERMRIDSSGNLLVGRTSNLGTSRFVVEADTTSTNPMTVSNSRSTAATDYSILFYRNASLVGSVQTSLTATSYVTSSDYRLKENVQPMQNALDVVAQLNPVTYTWKADGSDGQGFIAHELQAVVPDCVTGEKDAVDAEGNPVYQGIDTSFLVATLTKAIQEQQAQIETLTAKVAALEAK